MSNLVIKIKDNSFEGVDKFKNPYWVNSSVTPNEKYYRDKQYRKFVDRFCRINGIPGQPRFFEVRLIRQKTVIELRKYWWDHPYWMDKVFWVFQKPDYTNEANKLYGWYALEPFECLRIINKTIELTNNPKPFADPRAALIIPTECMQICWDETKAGYSEHIHHREPLIKTPAQVSREAERNLAAAKLLEKGEDIRNSKRWDDSIKQFENKLFKARKKAHAR